MKVIKIQKIKFILTISMVVIGAIFLITISNKIISNFGGINIINIGVFVRPHSFQSDSQEMDIVNGQKVMIYYNNKNNKTLKCYNYSSEDKIESKKMTVYYDDNNTCSSKMLTISRINPSEGIINFPKGSGFAIGFICVVVGILASEVFTMVHYEYDAYSTLKYFESHKPTFYRVLCNNRSRVAVNGTYVHKININIDTVTNGVINIKKKLRSSNNQINRIDVLVDINNPKKVYVTDKTIDRELIHYYEIKNNTQIKNEE